MKGKSALFGVVLRNH